MTFEDDNGERLSVPGEITFSYPIDQFGNDTDLSEVRVWTMNPNTGKTKIQKNVDINFSAFNYFLCNYYMHAKCQSKTMFS